MREFHSNYAFCSVAHPAGSAHGLGTAALAAKEPEALPFCALAYALIGIESTVLVSIPAVQAALLAITG